MRKEYRKAVRALFAEGLRARLPQFSAAKVASPVLLGGESTFRWKASDRLHAFVLLVPDAHGRQAFTVELAWSGFARFPETSIRPTLLLGPGDPDPIEVPEGILRLGVLADRKDAWWELPDPALEKPGDLRALQESLEPITAAVARARAAEPVESALRTLEEVGRPFFEQLVAQHHPVPGPSPAR